MRSQHAATMRLPSIRRATAREVMAATLATLPEREPAASGRMTPVVILDGDSASMKVVNGQLLLEDGSKSERRVLQLTRTHVNATRGWRIVILAFTLDALAWCQALDVQVIALDPKMETVILHGAPTSSDDARLRRAQALAPDNAAGLKVTRFLLERKVRGQRDVLGRLGYQVDDVDRSCEAMAGRAETVRECLGLESVVASIYWQCWSEIACTWSERDLRHIPQHWRTAGQRTSNRGKSPRNAITPVQAMLNYAYKLLETETVIALRKVGLDPGMGVFHTDKPNRASMALDCMEAVRPMVDAYVLDLVESRVFGKGDVMELLDGTCRLLPPVSHLLTQQLSAWRQAIAPVVEHVTNLLRPTDALGRPPLKRTPLTRANASRAQAEIKRRKIRAA